jgi:hypothetical protein
MTKKCKHCGQPEHPAICPTIKAIEYFANGKIKRVEYKTPANYAMPIYPNPSPQPPQPARPWEGPWVWTGTTWNSEGCLQ